MASLGSLNFNIHFKNDPKELEEIKKRALEQLKDLEVKFGISASFSKEDLTAQIHEIIAKERKLNLTVDKEKVGKDVSDAVSGANESASVLGAADAYKELEGAINSVLGTRGQNIKRLVEEKNALSSVQYQLKILEKQQRMGVVLDKDQLKTKASLINKELEHKQAITELNQLIKSDVKINQVASSSMDDLSLKLGRMKTAYRGLSEEMRDSPFGVELKNQITLADKEIKNLDASIGNHQRNVGNYKSHWDGLGFQFQQVARELPSMAYGAKTFFSAISNNIPMLADEIKKAGIELKHLRAEHAQGINLNKKAVPVWRQLVGSIFSWQTALIAVITVLTLYGDKIVDWVKRTLSFKDSLKLTRQELKKLNEEFAKSVGKEISQLNDLFDRLNKATEGTTEWNAARAAIINQHGETLRAMSTEIATLNDKAGAYRTLRDEIYATAKAEAITNATSEAQTKATQKAVEGYAKIYEEAASKKGQEYADDFIRRIRTDLETVGDISKELSEEIEEIFTFDTTITVGTSTSGSTQNVKVQANYVKDAIKEISDAENEYLRKWESAEKPFAWLKVPDKELKENKAYWEGQLQYQQDLLNNLDKIQAKGEEGKKIRSDIANIQEILRAYDTESGPAGKENKPLKDHVSLLKEAFAAYNEFSSIKGSKIALEVVQDTILPGFNPEKYREEVRRMFEDKSLDISVRKEAASILFGLDKDSLSKELKEVEDYIAETIRGWELFNHLFQESGDFNFSMKASFGGDIAYKSVVEQLAANIQEEIDKSGHQISLDELILMPESEVKSDHGDKLAAYVKAYKEQQLKIKEETVKNAAELINIYKTHEQKKKEIISKGQEDISTLIKSGASEETVNEAAKRMKESLASLDFKEFKETDLWVKTFEDLDRLSTSSLDNIIEKLEEFKETIGKDLSVKDFKELMSALIKIRDEKEERNPFASLIAGIKELGKADNPDAVKEAQDKINDALNNTIPYADALSNSLGALQKVFDSFGNESMSDALGTAQSVLGGAANIAQGATGLMSGNPLKMAQGAANVLSGITNIVGSIAAAHDKKLDRAIERSQREVSKLKDIYDAIERQLERSLGPGREFKPFEVKEDEKSLNNITWKIEQIKAKGALNLFDLKNLSEYSKEADKLQKRLNSFKEGGAYGYQRALLEKQREELEKQRKAEEDKKKSDKGKLDDYDVQLEELREEITYFSEDVANALYGIDLKGWASQLGDALYEAWKKGEDGAEAFKNTAADIIGNVMNEMLKLQILEPIMNEVREALFGEDGKGGFFGKDFELDESEVALVADILMKGEKKSEAYYEALGKLNDYLEENHGVSLKGPESTGGGGLSAGIKGITEDTAGLLASYVNAIRADVNQQLQLMMRGDDSDDGKMNALSKAQLGQLKMIATNTGKSADNTDELVSIFSAVVAGTKKLSVK